MTQLVTLACVCALSTHAYAETRNPTAELLAAKVEIANLTLRLQAAQMDAAQCDSGWSSDRAKLASLLLRDADASRKAALAVLKTEAEAAGQSLKPVLTPDGHDSGLVELTSPTKE